MAVLQSLCGVRRGGVFLCVGLDESRLHSQWIKDKKQTTHTIFLFIIIVDHSLANRLQGLDIQKACDSHNVMISCPNSPVPHYARSMALQAFVYWAIPTFSQNSASVFCSSFESHTIHHFILKWTILILMSSKNIAKIANIWITTSGNMCCRDLRVQLQFHEYSEKYGGRFVTMSWD